MYFILSLVGLFNSKIMYIFPAVVWGHESKHLDLKNQEIVLKNFQYSPAKNIRAYMSNILFFSLIRACLLFQILKTFTPCSLITACFLIEIWKIVQPAHLLEPARLLKFGELSSLLACQSLLAYQRHQSTQLSTLKSLL